MTALSELLEQDNTRQQIISDCVSLVETEIRRKSGLTGVAIKTAFTLVNKVDPRFVQLAISSLIDEFINAMNPLYTSYKEAGSHDLKSYWIQEKTTLANSLLSVADIRMSRAKNKVLKKAYSKLRPSGLKHVEESVPGIADVVSKYVS